MVHVELPLAASAHTTGTYHRILDVAERLFAERGIIGTSIRNITDQANVNVAAVNYHFDTKEKLVHTVIERRFQSLENARSEALDEVQARCLREARAPEASELVDALIEPIFRHAETGDAGWLNFLNFVSRLAWEPGAEKYSPPSTSLEIFARFDVMLKQAIPALAQDKARRSWRIAFMRAASQQTLLMIAAVRSGRTPNAMAFVSDLNNLSTEEIKNELIAFVAAGLAAK